MRQPLLLNIESLKLNIFIILLGSIEYLIKYILLHPGFLFKNL
jgi:hypothetical protein